MNQYYQRQNVQASELVSGNIRCMRIFASNDSGVVDDGDLGGYVFGNSGDKASNMAICNLMPACNCLQNE